MVDSSYIEMLVLVAKPLTEEFEPPWTYVRMVFWGIIPIAVLSFVTGIAIESTPEYEDIRTFFNNFSIITTLLALALYSACAWNARQVYEGRQHEKADRVRRFQD